MAQDFVAMANERLFNIRGLWEKGCLFFLYISFHPVTQSVLSKREVAMRTKILLAAVVILSTLLLATGCGPALIMRGAEAAVPDRSFAVVNFIRPSVWGGATEFSVWDGEELVGSSYVRSVTQHKARAGKHLFMVKADNWAGIKANVEAGKHYYVFIAPRYGGPSKGTYHFGVELTVLDPDDPRVNEWMSKLGRMEVDPVKRDEFVAKYIKEVRKAAERFRSGSEAYDTMGPEKGK
jgi:hypothetical protein